MEWAHILAYITGTVDQELLLRNEYLAAENRIFKAQLQGRLRLSDAERATLGEIGHRLGREALGEVATAALPDTKLGWYRTLVSFLITLSAIAELRRDRQVATGFEDLYFFGASFFAVFRIVRGRRTVQSP
jgi:hypothetical protein